MSNYNHVGRPTNEEVLAKKCKKKIKIGLILFAFLFVVGGIYFFFNKNSLNFLSIMGNSSTKIKAVVTTANTNPVTIEESENLQEKMSFYFDESSDSLKKVFAGSVYPTIQGNVVLNNDYYYAITASQSTFKNNSNSYIFKSNTSGTQILIKKLSNYKVNDMTTDGTYIILSAYEKSPSAGSEVTKKKLIYMDTKGVIEKTINLDKAYVGIAYSNLKYSNEENAKNGFFVGLTGRVIKNKKYHYIDIIGIDNDEAKVVGTYTLEFNSDINMYTQGITINNNELLVSYIKEFKKINSAKQEVTIQFKCTDDAKTGYDTCKLKNYVLGYDIDRITSNYNSNDIIPTNVYLKLGKSTKKTEVESLSFDGDNNNLYFGYNARQLKGHKSRYISFHSVDNDNIKVTASIDKNYVNNGTGDVRITATMNGQKSKYGIWTYCISKNKDASDCETNTKNNSLYRWKKVKLSGQENITIARSFKNLGGIVRKEYNIGSSTWYFHAKNTLGKVFTSNAVNINIE